MLLSNQWAPSILWGGMPPSAGTRSRIFFCVGFVCQYYCRVFNVKNVMKWPCMVGHIHWSIWCNFFCFWRVIFSRFKWPTGERLITKLDHSGTRNKVNFVRILDIKQKLELLKRLIVHVTIHSGHSVKHIKTQDTKLLTSQEILRFSLSWPEFYAFNRVFLWQTSKDSNFYA